jgi:hypothetical protein
VCGAGFGVRIDVPVQQEMLAAAPHADRRLARVGRPTMDGKVEGARGGRNCMATTSPVAQAKLDAVERG